VLAVRGAMNKGFIPEKFTFFWRKESPFSQHHPCSFQIEGFDYNCSEQWMMHQKTLLFGEQELADRVMGSINPVSMKRYGRQIRNFNQDTWNKYAYDIVYRGNVQKFIQNPNLWVALKATGGTTLAEASLTDKIWGIGAYATEPAAQQRNTWRGKNWLV